MASLARGGVPEPRSKPRAVFLMGLPGAGKTTVKRRRLMRGELDIEPDSLKPGHPWHSEDMGDETDLEVHRWSVRRAADQLDVAVERARHDVTFDSSGSNARWLGRRISDARRAGFRTELLWVDVPLEVALLRNRDRAYERGGHWCPEAVIVDKAQKMEDSYRELAAMVDSAERLQNWNEEGRERSAAELDLYLYPAPRAHPPSRRPGEDGYGEPPPGACEPSTTPGSLRTMRIGPWKRNEQVAREKCTRLAWMDDRYRGNRERYILDEVLGRRDVLLEPNAYPYLLPKGIEHWTVWSRRPMNHGELCEWVEAWIRARPERRVVEWNYDDNRGRRTIDVWHVHVYFRVDCEEAVPPRGGGSSPATRSYSEATTLRRSEAKTPCRSPCSV